MSKDNGRPERTGVNIHKNGRLKTQKELGNVSDKTNNLKDGEPCSHVGCLNHVTHPCEGCGRTAGRTVKTDMPTKDDETDPSKCPHGLSWLSCKNEACFKELCKAEDEAYCPHGFLVGCPVCDEDMPTKTDSDMPESVYARLEQLASGVWYVGSASSVMFAGAKEYHSDSSLQGKIDQAVCDALDEAVFNVEHILNDGSNSIRLASNSAIETAIKMINSIKSKHGDLDEL